MDSSADAHPSIFAGSKKMKDSPLFLINVAGKSYQILSRNLIDRVGKVSDSPQQDNITCQTRKENGMMGEEGEVFLDFRDTNSTQNLTRLEQLVLSSDDEERARLCDLYCTDTGLCYFDRSSQLFDCVLDFHRYGILHAPPDVCPNRFKEELKFWNIEPCVLSPCCSNRLRLEPLINHAAMPGHSEHDLNLGNQSSLNGFVNTGVVVGDADVESLSDIKSTNTDMFEGKNMSKIRRTAWRFMEDPASSCGAKLFAIVSVGFVLVSVLCLIVSSLPEFEVYNDEKQELEPHSVLVWIEIVCILWFTMEYCTRLIITSQRLEYMRSPLNVIDAISILPFYFELVLEFNDMNISNFSNIKGALLVMRILRVLRVARVFRLARYSGGMKSFGQTLKASYREIGMLMMFMSTTIILFSTTVYFLEKDVRNTPFVSIPATFWWCIVTMTTVGYGDLVPTTVGGKLVASMTSVSGVIVLAFPITIIVENFNKYYRGGAQVGGSVTGDGTGPRIKVHRFGI